MNQDILIAELTELAKELTAYLQPSKEFEELLRQKHGTDYDNFRLDKIIQINNLIDAVNVQLTKSTEN
jgi:hypothetical protein